MLEKIDKLSQDILLFSFDNTNNNQIFIFWIFFGLILSLFHTFIFNRFLKWDKKEIYFALFSLISFIQSGYASFIINTSSNITQDNKETFYSLYWKTITLIIAHTYISRPWLVRLEENDNKTTKNIQKGQIGPKMSIFTSYAIVNEIVEQRIDVRSLKRLISSFAASLFTFFAISVLFVYLIDFHRGIIKLFVPLFVFKLYHFFIIFLAIKNRIFSYYFPVKKNEININKYTKNNNNNTNSDNIIEIKKEDKKDNLNNINNIKDNKKNK